MEDMQSKFPTFPPEILQLCSSDENSRVKMAIDLRTQKNVAVKILKTKNVVNRT